MHRRFHVEICRLTALVFVLIPTLYAQSPDKAKVYVDDDYGITVTYPGEGWQRGTNVGAVMVPGELCRCWSRAGMESITLFRQNAGRPVTARFLVDQSANAIEGQLGAAAKEKAVKTVAGMQAMSMIISGKGTGGAIDGQGNVETTQHWIAIPREKDVIVLLLTSPQTDFAKNEKVFERMLATLKLTGSQSAEQRASK